VEPPAPGFALRAGSAILVDGTTGAVLFEHNADAPRPPASVTKILTALVILEHGQLSDIVTVSRRAAGVRGYDLGLRAGQRVSLEDLLAAILIRSANDAAVAAAEHVGGSVAGFAELMNAKARGVGMTQSHFANPHGLDEPGHVTTARDMAQLTRSALEQPHFARLVSVREATVNVWHVVRRNRNKKVLARPRLILSHNRLLGRVDGADGVKTGYTGGAGRCLVASATRGGQRMIAVLLNDPHRWTDAERLLEYGFQVAGSSAGPAHTVDRIALEHTQEVLP
jgi:D-alanyl-D-alanine carboxypeptidase